MKKLMIRLFRAFIFLIISTIPSSEFHRESITKDASNVAINHSGTQIVIMNCANCTISK